MCQHLRRALDALAKRAEALGCAKAIRSRSTDAARTLLQNIARTVQDVHARPLGTSLATGHSVSAQYMYIQEMELAPPGASTEA